MGFRTRGRIRVCKGVYINVGKKGITSVSGKVGGATINVNRKGRVKATTKVCKGVSYETTLKQGKQTTRTTKAKTTTTTQRKPTKKELEQMRIAEEQRQERERIRQEVLKKQREEEQLQYNLRKLNTIMPKLQNRFTKYNEMVRNFNEQVDLFKNIDDTFMTGKEKLKLMKKNIRLCNRLEIHIDTIDREIQEFIRLCYATGVKNETDFTEWFDKKVTMKKRLYEFRKGLRKNVWSFRFNVLILPFKITGIIAWGLINVIGIILSLPFVIVKDMFKGE